jgi:IclR family transcriptional regulator, negative regulator of allantoin and glyoxylate utilization operons
MTEVRRRGRPGQAEPVAQKGAQALERGIAILQYLEKSGGSSSVSDISLNLDLPLSTTFRLLKVLQAADFVYQDSQLGWWHIGLGVFNVGAAYIHNRDVLSVAGPFMRRLMLLSGETVNVAIRNGNEAVLIGQLECKSMVRMCAPLGSRLPLHASGAGKALLYPLAEEELMSIILQTGLQNITTRCIAISLRKKLKKLSFAVSGRKWRNGLRRSDGRYSETAIVVRTKWLHQNTDIKKPT